MNIPNLSALAVRERAITLFLIIAISLSGIYAFFKLGRAEDPAFTVKVLTVTTQWPGATAEEMQNLVAEPLEKRIQELRWLDHVDSFSYPGLNLMVVLLKDSMPPEQVQDEFYQLRKKLQDERPYLPQGTQGPFINDEYSDVAFGLYALQAPGYPARLLSRHAEQIRSELLTIPGVQKVNILGEQAERIYINIDETQLHALGLDLGSIVQALQHSATIQSAGKLQTLGPQVELRLDGTLQDIKDIAKLTIQVDQHTLQLGDIAQIERGYEDPGQYITRYQQDPALVLEVVMQAGWNGLELGKSLQQAQQKIDAQLPLGFSFKTITDQSININQAVDEFMLKFFAALGVVMLVSMVSMGWRVGIVVSAAVPLTLAMVFIIMLYTGRDFDRVTLGALIISLGLLVDDAIIAIEIMLVKMESGLDRVKAAAYAWNHTAAPMLSGTLVTIIGFLPVGFARSSSGEYAGNIFWILAIALLASWVVAVIFTPYMGVKLLPKISPHPQGSNAIYQTPNYQRLRRTIAWSVQHKYGVSLVVLAALILSAAGMGLVQKQFFPTSDRPELLVEIQHPLGTSLHNTLETTQVIEDWLAQQAQTTLQTSYVGQGAPRFFLSYNPELRDPAFARIVVLTPGHQERDTLMHNFRQAVADGLAPQARVRVSQLVFGPATNYPVEFLVKGPDPQQLREFATQAQALMRQHPAMRQVNANWGEQTPILRLKLDQNRLEALGLDRTSLAQQLSVHGDGLTVSEFREGIRHMPIIIRSAQHRQQSPDALADISISNKYGQKIPLSQVAELHIESEEALLQRRNRIPTMVIRGDIDDKVQAAEVAHQLMQNFAPLIATLPTGYSIELAGITAESDKANDALAPLFPIMIVLMLLVIVIQVRSLSAMLMVFLTAPLGLIGAVPALLIFQQAFGFTAILGLIGLAGILMRNTLILIGQIHTNRELGASPYEAVIEATVQRARPVILTALAAVLAFIPLSFSVFWGSMALTLIGGTAVGTLLTLLFLPSLYAIWYKINPASI